MLAFMLKIELWKFKGLQINMMLQDLVGGSATRRTPFSFLAYSIIINTIKYIYKIRTFYDL